MGRVWAWIGRREPGLLLLLLPAILFLPPAGAPLLLLLPALWLCRRRAGAPLWPALAAPALALLLVLLGDLFVTPDPAGSFSKLANLLFGLTLLGGLASWTRTPRRLEALGWCAAALGAALALAGLLSTQWPAQAKVPVLAPLTALAAQLSAPLGLPGAPAGVNPNETGGVLAPFVPLLAALLWAEGRGRRCLPLLLAGAAALLMVGGVALATQSRAALLGVAFGLLALPAWRGRSGRLIFAGVLLALAGLALAGWLEPLLQGGRMISPATDFDTLGGRVRVWQRALYFLAQAPLTGIGLNQFRLAVPAFWPLSSPAAPQDLGHAHNLFLHVAVELGLPGLLAYLWLWIAGLRLAGRAAAQPASWGAAGGLVALLFFGLIDAVAPGARAGFPFWLLLALAAGGAGLGGEERAHASLQLGGRGIGGKPLAEGGQGASGVAGGEPGIPQIAP